MGVAVGVVPLEGRGDLPLADLHGEPMFLHSVRALVGTPGIGRVVVTAAADHPRTVERMVAHARLHVDVVDPVTWWLEAHVHPRLVLADPLCPLLPSDYVARVLAQAHLDTAVAGYRPVTDTVKTVVDQQIAGTLDRDSLAVVVSPVVLPGHLVRAETPPTHDFALLAAWLRKRGPVELVKAPSMARRVGDESALRVLECLDELGRRVHEA